MICRSSKLRLNQANKSKIQKVILTFFDEFLVSQSNELANKLLYSTDKIPKKSNSSVYKQIIHPSSHIQQNYANEVLSVVNSIRNKLSNFDPDGNMKKFQKEIYMKFNDKSLRIKIGNKIQYSSTSSIRIEDSTDSMFDYWIRLKFKSEKAIYLPVKINRHIKNLLERGYILQRNTCLFKSNGEIQFSFRKETPYNQNNDSIGIDVGRNKSFVCSNGISENTTKPILNSLKIQKHGSKNKTSKVRRLKQTIDKQIKKIPFESLKSIYLERLTNFKNGNKFGNINHHWSYRYIQNRINLHAEESNVLIRYVNAAYTSQMCSSCGFTHTDNRKGEAFVCVSCRYEIDADLNAAINIHNRGTKSVHYQKENIQL